MKSKSLLPAASFISARRVSRDAPGRVLLYSSQLPILVLLNGLSGRGRVYHNFHPALILSRMPFPTGRSVHCGAVDVGGKFGGAVADEHAVREAGRAGVGTDPSAGDRVRADQAGVSKSGHG